MIQKQPNKKASQKGFTLVELSIVLVIIGLIVGGVLAGQSLITAAKIRAQMTQLDQFDAGFNAFRAKYDCLPGDCTVAQTPTFSQTTARTASTTGTGSVGDGNIDYVAAVATSDESLVAWNQLGVVGVIAGTYTPVAAAALPGTALPAGKSAGYVMLGGVGGTTFYNLAGYNASANSTPVIPAGTAAAVDKKRDDGISNTGSVRSLASGENTPFGSTTADATPYAGSTADAACNNAAFAYQSGKDQAVCVLRVRVSG
jgi:prepilin-type N-terminal cleavage/methylation domain-containing protein